MEIYKPIFIIGVPRSGTTLLYTLMAQHKDLAWFSQNDISILFSKEFLKFYNLRKRLFDIRGWDYGGPVIPNYDIIFDVPIEFSRFWDRYIGEVWADEKDVKNSAQIHLRDTISQIIIKKKKKRFLSKYPRNSVRIKYLNQVFPGSIFINIVRDGRAVVASMIERLNRQKTDYFGTPLKNANQLEFDLLERHAHQWVEVLDEINNAKNSLEAGQFFELKYEDLILDPKKWLEKIFSACGLEKQNVFQNSVRRVIGKRQIEIISEELTGRNELWKNKFSKIEIDRLNKIMKGPLERFEYL